MAAEEANPMNHQAHQATIATIRELLEALLDEAARVAVLDAVLQNRCRKCLDYDPQGSFWCCYDSRGG
jgi:hypothetical protein